MHGATMKTKMSLILMQIEPTSQSVILLFDCTLIFHLRITL